tara:strand:+ start:424 stop:873 length:450 start_codon:yes stop_codon:yes gene_type:complete
MAIINDPNKPDYTGASSQEYINKYTNRPEDAGTLEGLQKTLSDIGTVGIEPADMLNSLLYAMQGKGKEAGLSALSMLPFLGGITKASLKTKPMKKWQQIAEQQKDYKRLEDDYFNKELNWQDIEDVEVPWRKPKSLIKSLFESLKGKEF